MSEEAPRTYSALSSEEQSAVSVRIDSFEASYEYEGAAALKQAVRAAPDRLRPALVSQLLPPLIDRDRQQQGSTPTLHELRARFPELAGDLSAAYPLLPDAYRLPVELRGYRVLRVVGEGGQAIILRAQDDMHSAVAIKLSASSEHNELILRERELLGQCQHPGIPEVITSGVDEDRAFFIMPFLRGMTLADKYSTHRPSAEEAARVTAELCGIVDHLHGHGILHRDIKPQNIWLDESGGVKLIDLGMAIDRSTWGSPRAAVAEFHGTPAFMSPEQAAADSSQDGELSDVFATGAVLYWLGTGSSPRLPGDQTTPSKITLYDQLWNNRNWPKSLKRICVKAIAEAPKDRYRSASQLYEALRSFRPAASFYFLRVSALALLLLACCGVLLGWSLGFVDFPATEDAPPINTVSEEQAIATSPTEIETLPPDDGSDTVPPQPNPNDRHQDYPSPPSWSVKSGQATRDASKLPPPKLKGVPLAPRELFPPPPGKAFMVARSAFFVQGGPSPSFWHLVDARPGEERGSPAWGQFPLSPSAQIGNAAAWLDQVSPEYPMGDFEGVYIDPHGFVPVQHFIKEINISPDHTPDRISTVKLGRMTEQDRVKLWDEINKSSRSFPRRKNDPNDGFAMHRPLGPSIHKLPGYLTVEPGWKGLNISVRFNNGRLSKSFHLANDDPCAVQPVPAMPGQDGNPPPGLLYLYQYDKRPGRRSNLLSYVTNPQHVDSRLREVMAKTYVGFYAKMPTKALWTVISTQRDRLVIPETIEPGLLYVHFVSADKKPIKVSVYNVSRQHFENLAATVTQTEVTRRN